MVQRKGRTRPSADTVEAGVIAVAKQFGRLLGMVQAKAGAWVDPQALTEQLTQIRDGAGDLLGRLERAAAAAAASLAAPPARKPPAPNGRTASRAAGAEGRSGGKVDAPGKTHRKRPARERGVKHSNQMVSKLKTADTMRRGARRG